MMIIKQATRSDIDIIQTVGRQSYMEHFSEIWTNQGLEDFLNSSFSDMNMCLSIDNPTHVWFLCMLTNNECIGIAKLNLNQYEENLNCEGVELEKIYFLKEFVGQGYAEKFIHFIFDFAHQKAQKNIYLSVLGNNTRAQRFYEKHGFLCKAHIPYCTDICDIGMNIMQLKFKM